MHWGSFSPSSHPCTENVCLRFKRLWFSISLETRALICFVIKQQQFFVFFVFNIQPELCAAQSFNVNIASIEMWRNSHLYIKNISLLVGQGWIFANNNNWVKWHQKSKIAGQTIKFEASKINIWNVEIIININIPILSLSFFSVWAWSDKKREGCNYWLERGETGAT